MLDILFQDNHLLAVNKPPGLLTQDSGTGKANLEDEAKQWIRETRGKTGAVFLHAVHRIDKPVSGVVLFARTSKALSRLNQSVRERRVQKIYVALIEKGLPAEEGELRHWLLHASHHTKVVPAGTPEAKEACLFYRMLPGSGAPRRVEIRLLTGRYHQIRAQLAAAGSPILGDRRYGGHIRDFPNGIALHHCRLTVPHPVTKEDTTFEAPCPDSWKAFP